MTQARRFFGEPAPRLYATRPGAPFALSVAYGVLARNRAAGGDALSVSDIVLVASTRRAIRGFRTAFAHAQNGVAVTPRLTALGDLDPDLLEADDEARDALEDGPPPEPIPPGLDPLRRQLLLSRLVRGLLIRQPHLGAPCVAPQLAADLAALLDDCWAAGASLERLATLAPERHAQHWALSQQFLGIIVKIWPEITREQPGAPIDPAERRRRQALRLLASWKTRPPQGPVIVAGSPTDATAAALMIAAARLPQGAVILPGFDRMLDAGAARSLLDGGAPEHPQAALARLAAAIGVDPQDGGVPLWEGEAGDEGAPRRGADARARLISQALRPAPATDAWRDAAMGLAAEAGAATAGLTLLEAASSREEAAAAALALREALETPGRTAALITPDRSLARRVSAELARWGVSPDDSSGRPLALTPPGVFLHSVLEAAASDGAPAPLLALLKHPLAGASFERGPHLRLARRLEREVLRAATRPLLSLSAIRAEVAALEQREAEAAAHALDEDLFEDGAENDAPGALEAETPRPDALGLGPAAPESGPSLLEWFDRVAALLRPFAALMAEEEVDLGALLAAHEAAASALSEQIEGEAARPQLYDKIAGRDLGTFLAKLRAEADAFGPIAPRDYPALLAQLIGQVNVREPFGRHPRVLILGALEARMQSADLVILAGLNEGVWPKPPQPDAWLSREMRRELGLPALEERIGLSAHDFTLALGAPQAILSRTRKADGAPTTPSRWLLRLTNLLNGVDKQALAAMRGRGEARLRQLALLEAGPSDAARPAPAPRPRPAPPIGARPTRLSVTDVETLIRDPYAIYAKKTLRLRALPPLEAEPDHRQRGQLLHAVVEAYIRKTMLRAEAPESAAEAEALFDAAAAEELEPYRPWPTLHAFWRARLAQLRDWFLEGEAARREEGAPAALETRGALRFETALGACWLTATADRIDRLGGGPAEKAYAIYDYKAGAPPTAHQRAIFAKQLPLEAAILSEAGFEGAAAGPVARLAYLSLTGGEGGGAETVLEEGAAALAAEAMAGLKRLMSGYADANVGYAARLRPQHIAYVGDYDHLSRFGEWRREDAA
ncbi:MAG: double-strand break repair protein AddB [Pseudomonadota bacterium]